VPESPDADTGRRTVNDVLLEHLVMRIDEEDRLVLRTQVSPLPSLADPVQVAAAAHPGAFTHSTSWRWAPHGVILTFVHVYPDGSAGGPGSDEHAPDDGTVERFTAHDLEALPVCCHAVRHLHFLVRTDAQIAEITGYDRFWAFAAAVADQHYPAVAGLLPDAPEYQI
jgi:hypothetical protein